MKINIKCEYPFPENKCAFLAREWGYVVHSDECSDDAVIELNNAVIEQLLKTQSLLNEWEHEGHQCEERIRLSWKIIKEMSNTIRCLSSKLDVRGELYGLEVLMDSFSEEQ